MRWFRIRWSPPLAAMLVGCQLLTLAVPALGPRSAAAQTAPTPVRRGQDYYDQSRFDEAIVLLKDLVDRGQLSGDDLAKAREVIARSYVKKGYPAQGREMFKAILRDRPDWRPDPIRVPPDEMEVFDAALQEYQAEVQPEAAQPTPEAKPDTVAALPAAPAASTSAPDAARVLGQPKETSGKKKPLASQWWVWALGAGVVGGAVVALGGGGDDGGNSPPDLPGFPGHP
jgi:hypothetical protein